MPKAQGKNKIVGKSLGVLYLFIILTVCLGDEATINLQLGGDPVTDGTAGFDAKVDIQGTWVLTKTAILKQLGNSISPQFHDIRYSTVSHGDAEHDDKTNLSDKDTIYVTVTPKTYNLEISGQLGFTVKNAKQFLSTEIQILVRSVIQKITLCKIIMKVQVLTTVKINIDYTVRGQLYTKSEADVLIDDVRHGLRNMTVSSFRSDLHNFVLTSPDDMTNFNVDDITEVETKILPTMTMMQEAHDIPILFKILPTIQLQKAHGDELDEYSRTSVVRQANWTWAQLQERISESVSKKEPGANVFTYYKDDEGLQVVDDTNFQKVSTVYVHATYKALLYNTPGSSVSYATIPFNPLKKNISEILPEIAIQHPGYFIKSLNAKDVSNAPREDDCVEFTVKWEDVPLTDKIAVGAQKLTVGEPVIVLEAFESNNFRSEHLKKNTLGSVYSVDGNRAAQIQFVDIPEKQRVAQKDFGNLGVRPKAQTDVDEDASKGSGTSKEGLSKFEIAMIILLSLGVIVVAIIALWCWCRRKQNYERGVELSLKYKGTW